MFKQIFSYEFNSWFNKASFYIYAVLIFLATAGFVALAGGVFDGNTASVSSLKYINSPSGILQMVGGMTIFAMLLFTNVCGDSIYKDFKTGAYHVMFSFPFSKPAYFFGKFLSAFCICLILIFCVGLGAGFGFIMPGINAEMIGPHSIMSYVYVYLVYMIPNTFFFCAVVFAIVTYTRSIIAGFIAMIVIYILNGVIDSALINKEFFKLAAMLDPFGVRADYYYTKYWTVDEYNNSQIPLAGYVIYNRILWVAIGAAILMWSYFSFSFETVPTRWNPFKRKSNIKSIAHKSKQIADLQLPKVHRAFDLKQKLTSSWLLSKIDLSYILKGGAFIVISILGLLIVGITLAFSGEVIGTKTYPTTANMLMYSGGVFRMFIILLTFVYTGLVINRRTDNDIYQLEDVSATRNSSFLISKFISITMMQAILLLLPILAAIAYQITQGYFNFELGLYLFDTYAIRWVSLLPWTLLAIAIYTIIPNFYIGLIVVLAISFGVNFLPRLGIEKSMFQYNDGPTPRYSDMTGYAGGLAKYYIYRVYWIFGGIALSALSLYFWRRGVKTSFKERIANGKINFSAASKIIGLLSSLIFLVIGGVIYYCTFVVNETYTSKESELQMVQYEKDHKRLESLAQPRIIDVNLNVELYPSTSDIDATGYYYLKNKTSQAIDTIVINHGNLLKELTFDRESNIGLRDTIMDIRTYGLVPALAPGDSVKMDFVLKNKKNTVFRSHSPVRENATFFSSSIFPSIGYSEDAELSDNTVRKKYGLPPRERWPDVTDTTAYGNTYISNCSDWIRFEIVIGTAADQLAMAPGQLQREWAVDDRQYYHYKMDQPMLNFYNISSARYEVQKDMWKDVELSIYYHKGHDFNLDRMMQALKDGFDYYTTEYSPYQFKQLRILEFPFGGFAQSFANTVPFAENAGFTAMVDDTDEGGVDYAYTVTAHELAHQWWAHQVIGAKVKGATMMSESLSEYSSLKVLEKRFGADKMRKFLKDALDKYLLSRQMESVKELPLAFNENQQYIHYQKGSLIFYALSDLIGEKVLNGVLSDYIKQVGFQEPPYTTSLELLALLREATPDSLQYFIDDGFEHITFYTNRIEDTEHTDNGDGTYTVDITAHVTKYRTDEKGKQLYKDSMGNMDSLIIEGKTRPMRSYPLSDYIDIGVFGIEEIDGKEKEKVLYLKKHKITEIENKFTITVNEEPKEVGIDPFNKLIDRDSNDNRRKLEKKE